MQNIHCRVTTHLIRRGTIAAVFAKWNQAVASGYMEWQRILLILFVSYQRPVHNMRCCSHEGPTIPGNNPLRENWGAINCDIYEW